VRALILLSVLFLSVQAPAAWASSVVSTPAYKKAYNEAVASGKTDTYAKIFALGFAEAKASGLGDARARMYTDAYVRAYLSARDSGSKPYDCEAYATDFAAQQLRNR